MLFDQKSYRPVIEVMDDDDDDDDSDSENAADDDICVDYELDLRPRAGSSAVDDRLFSKPDGDPKIEEAHSEEGQECSAFLSDEIRDVLAASSSSAAAVTVEDENIVDPDLEGID